MRYRWKLLMLLLAIAMGPMLVMSIFGTRAIRGLADTLVSQSRERLRTNAEKRLRLLVHRYDAILSAVRQQTEIALVLQAREVERCLAKDPPPRARVYSAEDFNESRDLPQDTKPSPSHLRVRPGGVMAPLKVSYSTQVFKLAPGVKRTDAAADIGRLSAMTPVYQTLANRLLDYISWHYTSLANGLHSAFPGHNGIPRGFDPRKQVWYNKALEASIPWTRHYVDPVTRQMVFAAAMPVRRPNGEIAGVTALVFPINRLLEHSLLLRKIPLDSSVFISYLAKKRRTNSIGVQAISRTTPAEVKGRSRHPGIRVGWLISNDDEQFQALIDDFAAAANNNRRMPYQGRDSLWVYGSVNFTANLVLITPYDRILEPARRAEQYIRALIDNLVRLTAYAMCGVVVLAVVLAFSFSGTVTKPLAALVDGTRRLADGHFDAQVDIRSRDEFGDVGRVFNSVGPRLEEHYKMRRSLDLAMEVQQNLLPKADPKVAGLDIAGKSIYCDETGGDYYDYLDICEHGQGEIDVVVGDVSGHGIPSALLMTTARAFLRLRSSLPGSIANVVADVNRQLVRDVEESGQFMTLFYLTIDAANRRLKWVRAGHDPAIFYDPAGDAFNDLLGSGMALGVDEDFQYEENEKTGLSKGQIVVLCTDGIWEAHNPEGEVFGKNAIYDIIREKADASANEIQAAILKSLEDFRRDVHPEDDVTLVVIKIVGDLA